MSTNYKNIVITPNRDTDAANVPSIRFSGGDATSNTDINVRVYTTQSGTLSFEGSAGQLFSITNDLTNSIFSVNDVSGIPSIDVNANGNIFLAPFGGQVIVGSAANLNFDSTLSTKIVEPAANTLAIHTAQTERLRVDANGNVGIGTANPTSRLQVNGTFFVTQNNTSQLDAIGEIAEFAHDSNTYAQIHVRNANTGTRSSSDIVATADIGTDTSEFIDLGINSSTYNDPTFTIGVAKDGYLYTSNGNLSIGTANTGKAIKFFTGGTLSTNERMRIGLGVSIGNTVDPGANNLTISGNLLLIGAASGLGYGTGSGGTITQDTSKATGVTLNKLAGAVTSHNAALASNNTVSFTVTNNLVASSDVVVVNRLSGGTAGAYVIWCSTVSTGSFAISMRNLTNGSLSEAVVMGYAVIKAVQA